MCKLLFILLCFQLTVKSRSESSTFDSKLSDDLKSSLQNGASIEEFEHHAYRERVKILREIISRSCQHKGADYLKRELSSDINRVKGDVERILYEKMVRLLIACQREKSVTYTSTKKSATYTSPKVTKFFDAVTTTSNYPIEATTTESPPEPEECRGAVNLTEYWRKDHLGSKINQGSENCDTRPMIDRGRPWFRFAGEAGNMMLNKCPPDYSCGTHGGIWTNDAMPTAVGVQTAIKAYASWNGGRDRLNCQVLKFSVSVMRCSNSTANNYIYKYTDSSSSCQYSFCGMQRKQ